MSVLECLACQHESPATAKFCSECGGQLNLKLCKQCEAINERAWQRCHKCGAEFAAQPTAHPSEARRVRRSRAVVSVLAFGTMTGLGLYLYTEPSLNGDQMRVGRLPAPSATRLDAGAAAVDVSTAKTQASVVPVATSKQRVTKADHTANPANARTFNKKKSAAAAVGDSAVRSSQESAATIASDYPKANVEYPPASTAPAASGASSAKPPKPQPAEPTVRDFHFVAPPP